MESSVMASLASQLKTSQPSSSLQLIIDSAVWEGVVSLMEVKEVLTMMIQRQQEERNYSLRAFRNYRRDLEVFTGINSVEVIDHAFLYPLLEYYKTLAEGNQSFLPSAEEKTGDRVLWTLMFLYSGFSFGQLHTLLTETGTFHKTVESFTLMIKNTAAYLAKCLSPWLTLLELPQWELHCSVERNPAMSKYSDQLMIIIDGTTLPICEPADKQVAKNLWVSYKHEYGWRYLVAVAPSGWIMFVSPIDEGKTLDSEQYSKSNLKGLLEQKYPLDSSQKYVLVGDKGYIYSVPPAGWDLLLTKSGEAELRASLDGQTSRPAEGDPGASGQFLRRFEAEIAPTRSVVERSIASIKRWKRLKQPCQSTFRQADKLLENLVMISAAYSNYEYAVRWGDSHPLLCREARGR
jgi:hypothetical protein